jgi:cytochrome P450
MRQRNRVEVDPDLIKAAGDDPFRLFDLRTGVDTVSDPYPEWHEQLACCPVAEGNLHSLLGHPKGTIGGDALRTFSVYGFAEVSEVLSNPGLYSSRVHESGLGKIFGETIMSVDPPAHTRLRAIVQQAFGPKNVARWNRELIEPAVAEHLSRIAPNGRADLVADLLFPVPVRVIAGILGLPEDDIPQFHRKGIELLVGETAAAASTWFDGYVTDVIEQRRICPSDDLISTLVAPGPDEASGLSDDQIVSFVRMMVPAGAETSYRAMSNLLFALLRRPEQLAAVRRDRRLVRPAIEESLRWEAPVTGLRRIATRDAEIAGVHIPAGSLVIVNNSAANRDEREFDSPDVFEIERPRARHRAFGLGPHFCLGANLARAEATTVLNGVLDQLPNVQLDPADPDVGISGVLFRVAIRLPVIFNVDAIPDGVDQP